MSRDSRSFRSRGSINPFRVALDYLLGGPKVGGAQEHRLDVWRSIPAQPLGRPHRQARYVVVDTETTGLDLRRDRLIEIGAVGVAGGVIDLSDCFERVLRQDKPSADANILIHGIGGQTQLSGVEPKGGMLDFLEYLRKSPLVAFRAEFDQAMIERAVRSILGYPFHHPWIDLALLLPALFRDAPCTTLDEWIDHFGLGGRKAASSLADAFATAELLQIVLTAARRVKMDSAAELIATQKAKRWLGTR